MHELQRIAREERKSCHQGGHCGLIKMIIAKKWWLTHTSSQSRLMQGRGGGGENIMPDFLSAAIFPICLGLCWH